MSTSLIQAQQLASPLAAAWPRVFAAPPSEGSTHDLWLGRQADGRSVGCWVETSGATAKVQRRLTDLTDGEVRSVLPLFGHPTSPRWIENHLLWCELQQGRGVLVEADLDDAGRVSTGPRPVALFHAADCGEFACAERRGSLWVLAQEFLKPGTRLRLLAHHSGAWHDHGVLDAAEGFRSRPRLCITADGVLATWDEWRDGRYGVVTAVISEDGTVRTLSLPDRSEWESLSYPCEAADGRLFVACCRERLIALDGAANHHSELAVHRLEEGLWREVALVNIDYAMNPWMAAYAGYRRFPTLIPDRDGVWLLWEEALDPDSMDPSLGRLCAVKVGADGLEDAPRIVMTDLCMFVPERGVNAPSFYVATKTQPHAYDYHLTWDLHHVSIGEELPHRPTDLPNNRERPDFIVQRVGPGPKADRPADAEPACSWEWGTQTRHLFFGDPHIHSRGSVDLDGEPDELYRFARDVAKLDFVAFTENDATRFSEPPSHAEWQSYHRLASLFNEPGRFTAFKGWEYTAERIPGRRDYMTSHRSVIFADSEAPIYSWFDNAAPTPAALIERLRGQRVLLHHHHPGGYDITDDTLECNIEIVSGWWNCMRRPDFVHNLHRLLHEGKRLGFIGGSDNHERNPGFGGALTGVWAEANTRDALFTAMQERRIFATTGLRPDLRFAVDDIMMGGVGHATVAPTVHLELHCEVPIRSICIIRDGKSVHELKVDTRDLILSWTDAECSAGRHWYYAHAQFAPPDPSLTALDWDAPMPLPWNIKPAYGIDAWSSPVWVEVA